ncbi:hypothetical protein AB0M45_22490 [Nocardia sp. NPDC051787]|uniref:hypothetical protein n=1 Tax=Nocardia sp. NPDC051787 TaxID=3155415 RepID=UPI003448CBFD
MSIYATSHIKRPRRTNAEIAEIDDIIYRVAEAEHPLTIRGAFYRVMSLGAVPKTEQGYAVVQRRVLAMRRGGRISYHWFRDGTRWAFRPQTWRNVDAALDDAASSYRRSLWKDQGVHLEVWSEKDAITSVVSGVTDEWDVPLRIARGFSSESFLWQTARDIVADRKPAVIYQLGDHDPSGVAAWEHTQRRLREFAPKVDFTFERLAVTEAQIEDYGLPTRPTKKSDSRARNFDGRSVEVDALPSPVLRELVGNAIEQWIAPHELRMSRMVERSERDLLYRIANEHSDPENGGGMIP